MVIAIIAGRLYPNAVSVDLLGGRRKPAFSQCQSRNEVLPRSPIPKSRIDQR